VLGTIGSQDLADATQHGLPGLVERFARFAWFRVKFTARMLTRPSENQKLVLRCVDSYAVWRPDMIFLKTLLWVALIIAVVVFAVNNWVPVSLKLWGGLLLDTKLPMLVIVSFIAGFFPLWIWHRGIRWRLKRRILSLEGSSHRAPLDLKNADIPNSSRTSSATSQPAGSGI
jgi:lipopolysaccharide assembly protein A